MIKDIINTKALLKQYMKNKAKALFFYAAEP